MEKKIKVRSYTMQGDKDQEYFFDDIREALEKYVKIRDSIPDFWNRPQLWPTIWVNMEEGFLRVHNFAFWDVTADSNEKYLAERIIDTDDLLSSLTAASETGKEGRKKTDNLEEFTDQESGIVVYRSRDIVIYDANDDMAVLQN